ncbi:MAG: cbb3-type cytochrome c oxidase subunit 3 [Phenylobacterium sp.]|uniref:cbb3-type cytochrome c oxidase subunit 3 n=1 Tax=Phenylobacterium sp. SCN 70-31 TaxID=1660129 RepID=UPI00086B5B92|nr:cbb3-type cytochrome c oxidase subunit 3 [Phenylobacterium sp. SCN 70-31]MCW5759843.1 cbb3-type cytochrome c oxidase subunit 3 [Phenylobacterium sp.]ODT89859.1 MAG: cytochrome-c oxidase [Phenylobacterium sp. SCN 70-31]
MSGLDYEAVAAFAQQGGTLYFGLIFLGGLIYALRPRHKADFDRLAKLPLEDDDHV